MSVKVKLARDSAEPSAPRALFPVSPGEGSLNTYMPTPDGRRILVSEPEKAARPLKVIVNWPRLLTDRPHSSN